MTVSAAFKKSPLYVCWLDMLPVQSKTSAPSNSLRDFSSGSHATDNAQDFSGALAIQSATSLTPVPASSSYPLATEGQPRLSAEKTTTQFKLDEEDSDYGVMDLSELGSDDEAEHIQSPKHIQAILESKNGTEISRRVQKAQSLPQEVGEAVSNTIKHSKSSVRQVLSSAKNTFLNPFQRTAKEADVSNYAVAEPHANMQGNESEQAKESELNKWIVASNEDGHNSGLSANVVDDIVHVKDHTDGFDDLGDEPQDTIINSTAPLIGALSGVSRQQDEDINYVKLETSDIPKTTDKWNIPTQINTEEDLQALTTGLVRKHIDLHKESTRKLNKDRTQKTLKKVYEDVRNESLGLMLNGYHFLKDPTGYVDRNEDNIISINNSVKDYVSDKKTDTVYNPRVIAGNILYEFKLIMKPLFDRLPMDIQQEVDYIYSQLEEKIHEMDSSTRNINNSLSDFNKIINNAGYFLRYPREPKPLNLTDEIKLEIDKLLSNLEPNVRDEYWKWISKLILAGKSEIDLNEIDLNQIQQPNMALLGPPGTGKTKISSAILKLLGAVVINVRFTNSRITVQTLVNRHFRPDLLSTTSLSKAYGLITDAVMRSGVLNPVIYIDEGDPLLTLKMDSSNDLASGREESEGSLVLRFLKESLNSNIDSNNTVTFRGFSDNILKLPVFKRAGLVINSNITNVNDVSLFGKLNIIMFPNANLSTRISMAKNKIQELGEIWKILYKGQPKQLEKMEETVLPVLHDYVPMVAELTKEREYETELVRTLLKENEEKAAKPDAKAKKNEETENEVEDSKNIDKGKDAYQEERQSSAKEETSIEKEKITVYMNGREINSIIESLAEKLQREPSGFIESKTDIHAFIQEIVDKKFSDLARVVRKKASEQSAAERADERAIGAFAPPAAPPAAPLGYPMRPPPPGYPLMQPPHPPLGRPGMRPLPRPSGNYPATRRY